MHALSFGHCPSSAPPSAPCPARSRVALYVGAGADVRPLACLVDVARFVLVDPGAPAELHAALAGAGFRRAGGAAAGGGPLRFRDDLGRALEYHADTAIPADAARLPEGACDVVVVAGRDPHRAAVDRACRPSGLAFVGLEGTAFDHDPRAEEPQGVVQLLHTDPAFRARFASFHLVSAEAPAVVLTWDAFLRAAGARAHA